MKLLCALGVHIYGSWQQTRFNPSMNLFTDHRYCSCGLAQARIVDGRRIPQGWTSMDYPPDFTGEVVAGKRLQLSPRAATLLDWAAALAVALAVGFIAANWS